MASFTTADNIRLFLNKDLLTPKEVAQVNMLIKMVDGAIINYCGWPMLATDYVDRKYDGNNLTELDLEIYNVNSLTKVTLDGLDVTSTISYKADEGVLYSDTTTFTSGTQNVLVTFNAGYVAIPYDLQMAATNLAVIYFNRIALENIGVVKERFNNVEAEYSDTDIPDLVKRILDRHRRIGIH